MAWYLAPKNSRGGLRFHVPILQEHPGRHGTGLAPILREIQSKRRANLLNWSYTVVTGI